MRTVVVCCVRVAVCLACLCVAVLVALPLCVCATVCVVCAVCVCVCATVCAVCAVCVCGRTLSEGREVHGGGRAEVGGEELLEGSLQHGLLVHAHGRHLLPRNRQLLRRPRKHLLLAHRALGS